MGPLCACIFTCTPPMQSSAQALIFSDFHCSLFVRASFISPAWQPLDWPATQWRTSFNLLMCSLLAFRARAQVSYPLLGNHWIGQQHNGAQALIFSCVHCSLFVRARKFHIPCSATIGLASNTMAHKL